MQPAVIVQWPCNWFHTSKGVYVFIISIECLNWQVTVCILDLSKGFCSVVVNVCIYARADYMLNVSSASGILRSTLQQE